VRLSAQGFWKREQGAGLNGFSRGSFSSDSLLHLFCAYGLALRTIIRLLVL
jgi:hypothetical protein